MSVNVIFKPIAVDDVALIKAWYKLQREGLEKNFVKELKSSINQLKQNKELFQIRYNDFRAVPLKKFPYLIYYIVQQNTIFVIAVLAAKQNQQDLLKQRL